jgi:hypothetical protein
MGALFNYFAGRAGNCPFKVNRKGRSRVPVPPQKGGLLSKNEFRANL